jgi:hypothetical protein
MSLGDPSPGRQRRSLFTMGPETRRSRPRYQGPVTFGEEDTMPLGDPSPGSQRRSLFTMGLETRRSRPKAESILQISVGPLCTHLMKRLVHQNPVLPCQHSIPIQLSSLTHIRHRLEASHKWGPPISRQRDQFSLPEAAGPVWGLL